MSIGDKSGAELPTTATKKQLDGPSISRKIFGGVLDLDGAGYYPGIELLNFVFCTAEGSFSAQEEKIKIRRRAHDFARRTVWDEGFRVSEDIREVLFDEETEEAVRNLLKCLQLPIPNLAKTPGWDRAHFFPYTNSLIHWDARKRSGKIQIQRKYLRGGGALAFRVLRMDPNIERKKCIVEAFRKLFEEKSKSALEKLTSALLLHGQTDQDFVVDEIEALSVSSNDELEEIYRNGLVNILEHHELTSVARIRALIYWTSFWLLLIQHKRASASAKKESSFIICDCGASQPQLRRASQRCLKDVQLNILQAIENCDSESKIAKRQKHKIRGFFWATAATIGLLNSWRGRRHFTLSLELIETLVMASVPGNTEISFEQFVDDWLFGQCSLVVGRASASKSGQLSMFDISVFEDNENHLASQMLAAGLLTQYSDATRMIGTGGLK